MERFSLLENNLINHRYIKSIEFKYDKDAKIYNMFLDMVSIKSLIYTYQFTDYELGFDTVSRVNEIPEISIQIMKLLLQDESISVENNTTYIEEDLQVGKKFLWFKKFMRQLKNE